MQMNLIGIMRKINAIGKYFIVTVMVLSFVSTIFASVPPGTSPAGLTSLTQVLRDLCNTTKSMLGVAMMLMVILAGVIYAVGQIMGAETRARATVWATAMLTGALFAAVIYLLAPWIIQAIYGSAIAC